MAVSANASVPVCNRVVWLKHTDCVRRLTPKVLNAKISELRSRTIRYPKYGTRAAHSDQGVNHQFLHLRLAHSTICSSHILDSEEYKT